MMTCTRSLFDFYKNSSSFFKFEKKKSKYNNLCLRLLPCFVKVNQDKNEKFTSSTPIPISEHNEEKNIR